MKKKRKSSFSIGKTSINSSQKQDWRTFSWRRVPTPFWRKWATTSLSKYLTPTNTRKNNSISKTLRMQWMLNFPSFANNPKETLKSSNEEFNKSMRVKRGLGKPKKPGIRNDLKFNFYFIYSIITIPFLCSPPYLRGNPSKRAREPSLLVRWLLLPGKQIDLGTRCLEN